MSMTVRDCWKVIDHILECAGGRDLTDAEQYEIRKYICIANKLPVKYASMLTGNSPEAINRDAVRLKGELNNKHYPLPYQPEAPTFPNIVDMESYNAYVDVIEKICE